MVEKGLEKEKDSDTTYGHSPRVGHFIKNNYLMFMRSDTEFRSFRIATDDEPVLDDDALPEKIDDVEEDEDEFSAAVGGADDDEDALPTAGRWL